ncbi:uncharacterized protein TRIADDRAFT_32981 [Trichoplax adhaerens]|uniref:E3 ubiquitin-protein transferase MAEA n=1 Tax=Trichoplax adhaerens TaxID=10228 RepID=B3SBV8_TRIAD|nr:hypothetical protein TRIADDRAFT_32981 [Trichoplax adhaerens]EDV19740.1 hypothetical protein TRIADDRAFT_32981 [Trichoplax adhaerens]|eukprot:XP_002117764.1 hypothetical protein TRIADDRAFT_32981 [Trichoplax adhaerens]
MVDKEAARREYPDIRALEHSTLKVPYEILNKKFRTAQKAIDREVANVLGGSNDILHCSSDSQNQSIDSVADFLGGVVQKLTALKRKADDCYQQEQGCIKNCKLRISHLQDRMDQVRKDLPENDFTVTMWQRKRCNRFIVDHLLRQGYYKAAIDLMEESDIEGLCNIEIFTVARKIEASLQANNITLCLNWCIDNRSRLKKIKSTLEFNLRMQEFIELIREGKRLDAVKYARRHFSNIDSSSCDLMKRAMGLLAFQIDTNCQPYQDMYDPQRWKMLLRQFRDDIFSLYQLKERSMFSVILQVGLASLKTPDCYDENKKSLQCPICSSNFNEIARTLPFSHCSHSRLVCRISGEEMNGNNPPMMLPNGMVYSEKALLKLADSNHGTVICPRTNTSYPFSELKRVFLL